MPIFNPNARANYIKCDNCGITHNADEVDDCPACKVKTRLAEAKKFQKQLKGQSKRKYIMENPRGINIIKFCDWCLKDQQTIRRRFYNGKTRTCCPECFKILV